MQDRFLETSYGKLHAQVGGEGEAALLIHGRDPAYNSWRTWAKNVDALSGIVKVYALDMLGYGTSDKPDPALQSQAHVHALAQLLDQEKLAGAHLIGLSWGGLIALQFVLKHPDRVRKLVLVDAAHDPTRAEDLARIQAPTLITWDETDVVIPVSHASVLKRAIPGSQLVTFDDRRRDPDADPKNRHWTQMTHSQEWNRAVTSFLRGAS